MSEPTTCHLTLADGRNLSYSDIGTGENGTWIHCHGIPGSRNELTHFTEALRRLVYELLFRTGRATAIQHHIRIFVSQATRTIFGNWQITCD